MNKNVMVKGLTALTILTSLGFAENISNQPHSIAKAEKNVKEITDATKEPYNSVVAFVGGTGVVVGKNTIVTNKHIAKSNDIFKNRVSAHHSSKGKGGGNYDVKEGLNFNKNVSYTKFADGAKVKDRISVIGYPHPYKNKYVLYESTGPVMSVEGSSIVYSAHTESGNSGSPVLNSNNELVGIHFASDVKNDDNRNAYGVYFTPEIKKFIAENIDK